MNRLMDSDWHKVTILCVGTSHRFVPVPILELAMHEAKSLRGAFAGATSRSESTFPFSELAVLATCNRVELYVACGSFDAQRAAAVMRAALGLNDAGAVYEYRDRDAVRHLCRVASGLDSLVVGEPQIAGQVARAFADVLHVNGGAPRLQAAAAIARRLNRRARAETGIARKAASISSVAVQVAAEQAGGLDGKHVLVLGAGKIGRLACETLRSSRAHITVANRTLERAETLARRVGAVPVPLFALPELLARADAVIASTASPVPLIDGDTVRRALALRAEPARVLLVIDIAVPRNVADDVRGIEGVRLTGIDDLRARVAMHLEERRKEIPRVEAIIDDELGFDGSIPISIPISISHP